MMMDAVYDPYDILFGDNQQSPISDSMLFTNEVMLGNFNTDSSSISPRANSTENIDTDFDPAVFEKLINELLSSDPGMIPEQSIDLPLTSLEPESSTREIGTDPMEPVSQPLPLIINSANLRQLTSAPIIFIQKPADIVVDNVSSLTNDCYNAPLDSSSLGSNDCPMEDVLPLTPSTSSDSPDEGNSNSPDVCQDQTFSKLLTNFDNLPRSGPLKLTNEEVKLIKQEGYQVPTKLPLSKVEEKMLKKIRRKIKNKISAQESRRKKKDYVDALEKQIAKYADENNTLKERMAAIEKSQKSLAKERDLLRSMLNKATPAPSRALMVFAVFFAVLFGIWSPIANKSSIDDRALSLENSLMPSNNHQAAYVSKKSLFEQQDNTHSNYITNSHKSRVLLSVDDHDTYQQYGPYLPSNSKQRNMFQKETAAPSYMYSDSIEKYINKKHQSEVVADANGKTHMKRSLSDDSSSVIFTQKSTHKKLRSNYHINEDIVVVEDSNNDNSDRPAENKSVKIIRVERAIPAVRNDTLKLAHRMINE
ncbi:unnamed protein product [Adineta ricciae]|uniref:BZIP domain-containing protein n=1 Tax=Adineta ricciae TaxID=249248 RepID=A0A814YR52_ADIRI|nr:unnamed protein product [Adineta ricciae]